MKQLLLPAGIPWYRTRLFWGVIIGLLIAWSLFVYFSNFNSSLRTGYWQFLDISIAFGGSIFFLSGSFLFGKVGGVFSGAIYFLLLAFLIFRTLKTPRVNLLFPALFILLFISGSFFTFFALSGF